MAIAFEELQLLTTNHDFLKNNLFSLIGMMSSATAQAAWMGVEIQSFYPDY